ncbi:hypothetical protein J4727_20950 [Providencia rettgeri]|uniref:Peptidase S11 D-Ala-D-Ala carboxypeptidase A C-terminal domain-containing protein n=1 Tax=Providencia rettgeri TaxID=587 RepID=A0A939SJU3_PRORE|nr:hypothetical protein [Providencia rettgeri]
MDFASVPVWFGDENEVKLGVTEDLYLIIPREAA